MKMIIVGLTVISLALASHPLARSIAARMSARVSISIRANLTLRRNVRRRGKAARRKALFVGPFSGRTYQVGRAMCERRPCAI
jgi:hypothetical protein